MRAAERRRLLGDAVIADIHRQVAEAPEPTPELIDHLRRILTRPAARTRQADVRQTAARRTNEAARDCAPDDLIRQQPH
jgi:hypothetical protein